MLNKPIIRQNTRVMTPREYRLLHEHLNPKYQIVCDVMISTGMRWEEFWDLCDHKEWFDPARRCVDLPKGAVKKIKAKYKERTINLTLDGCDALKTLFGMNHSIRYTDRASVGIVLKRAAREARIGETGISPKMFRKTLVSWLLTCYPEKTLQISASMGHDFNTMRIHYANLAFERRDVEDMRVFLKGWGEA